MKRIVFGFLVVLVSCKSEIKEAASQTFADARKGFVTKIIKNLSTKSNVDKPPANLFNLIEYPSALGNMVAYLSVIPKDGRLHPAMIWLIGGFGNDISETVWTPQDAGNDQSAAEIWKAGIVTMYPAQRGGNTNPGTDETCFGELDDIIAAAKYLTKQSGIDPKRIYIGGHSTGGTKALLVAEYTNMFRAAFCFGAVSNAADYGDEYLAYDTKNPQESVLRSPIHWLQSLQKPTFLFEGETGNIKSLFQLNDSATAENISVTHFYEVKNASHFSILQPVCKVIAEKVIADSIGDKCNIVFNGETLNALFK